MSKTSNEEAKNEEAKKRARMLHVVVVHKWKDGSTYASVRNLEKFRNLCTLFNLASAEVTVAEAYAIGAFNEAVKLVRYLNSEAAADGHLHDFGKYSKSVAQLAVARGARCAVA